jgi:hypothetical protein
LFYYQMADEAFPRVSSGLYHQDLRILRKSPRSLQFAKSMPFGCMFFLQRKRLVKPEGRKFTEATASFLFAGLREPIDFSVTFIC